MLGEFFYLHKSDRRVLLALLTVAAVAIAVIFLAGGASEPSADSSTISADTIDSPLPLSASPKLSTPQPAPQQPYYRQEAKPAEHFAFDPNTADSTQLLRLGLQTWQVRNIYKYRAAGGIYRKKEDFARLYGLTVKQYRELEPYIRISPDYLPAATYVERGTRHADGPTPSASSAGTDAIDASPAPLHPHKLQEGQTIDLATADTTLLMTVPGIGPYYARRIVEYRYRLGGFACLQQLSEIDGFPQQALAFLTLSDAPAVEKINVNTLSLNDLKRHPYVNFYMARAIVDYRRQHGRINDLRDLQLLPDFTPEAVERLLPYVDY